MLYAADVEKLDCLTNIFGGTEFTGVRLQDSSVRSRLGPQSRSPVLKRERLQTVEIDARQISPRLDGILENWSEIGSVGISADSQKDANLKPIGYCRTNGLEHLLARKLQKLDYPCVKAGLDITNVLLEVTIENDFRRLVVTLGSGKPANGVRDI